MMKVMSYEGYKMDVNIRNIYTYLLSSPTITGDYSSIRHRISSCIGHNMDERYAYEDYQKPSLMSRTFLEYWTNHPGRKK